MVAADLPPVADAIRSSLLNPPAGVHLNLLQLPADAEIAGFFAKHEAGVAKLGKVVDAHIAHVRSGIDELRARIAAGDDSLTLGIVEALISDAEQGLQIDQSTLSDLETSRARVAAMATRLRISPRLERVFRRLRSHGERHHDQLVEQTYRLRALAAEIDPSSRAIVPRETGTSAAHALRAALRA